MSTTCFCDSRSLTAPAVSAINPWGNHPLFPPFFRQARNGLAQDDGAQELV
jgi:hypothetical protein